MLATAGDRLALSRRSSGGGSDAVPFEVEVLDVIEVDAEGRLVALVAFDPDDRRAASVEMTRALPPR